MLIEIHCTAMQADRLRGSPGFIFLRRRLCAAALFSRNAVKGSRRFMQAGQTAVLNGLTLSRDSWMQNKWKIDSEH